MRLSDITDYLNSIKYTKARDHQEEVADFMEVLDKCSTDVFAILQPCPGCCCSCPAGCSSLPYLEALYSRTKT